VALADHPPIAIAPVAVDQRDEPLVAIFAPDRQTHVLVIGHTRQRGPRRTTVRLAGFGRIDALQSNSGAISGGVPVGADDTNSGSLP